MIEALQEKGYKVEKPKFEEVQFSNRQGVLLETKDKEWLVETWDYKENLNNFELFEKVNSGHFWINGRLNSFQIKINGEWKMCNEFAPVRFTRE